MIDQTYLEALKATAETALATAQACLKLIEQQQRDFDENKYVSLESAATALGDGISANMLKERCADGRFKHGVHFVNSSDGTRSNYLIMVRAARKYFETAPAKRPLAKR